MPRKGVHPARDSNGQQLPQVSTDPTSLAFPVIGAILILLFGGFLLSSGNSCCHVESSNKKKNEDEGDGIELLSFMDNVHFPKPLPVLQQENNDVVDAVMETYSDLPQYAPISELMASIPGVARQPETRDACVSPISCIDPVSLFPSNQDDVDGNQGNVHVGEVEEMHSNQEISEDSDVDDINTTEEESCRMDCTLNIINEDDADVDSACPEVNRSSGIGTCSRVNTPAISMDSGIHGENMRDIDIPAKDHLGEIKKVLNASFGFTPLETESKTMNDSFSHVTTSPSKQSTSFTRFALQKWIKSAKQSRDAAKESAVPYQWKRPAKLTKQDKIQLLRKLQPDLDASISTTVNKAASLCQPKTPSCSSAEQRNVGGYNANAHGGRLSCLKVVRAPSSMCLHGNICPYNCKSGHVTNEREERDVDDSGHGASCLGMSSRGSVVTPRGASALVESRSDMTTRGASAFEGPSRGASAFDGGTEQVKTVNDPAQRSSVLEGPTRGVNPFECSSCGASAFEQTSRQATRTPLVENYSKHNRSQERCVSKLNRSADGGLRSNVHGNKARLNCTEAKVENNRDHSIELRGVGGLGHSFSDCLSVAGTASVTLSMAVQSEREDITLASIASKNKPELAEHQVKKNEDMENNVEIFPLPANHRISTVVARAGDEEVLKLIQDEKIHHDQISLPKSGAVSKEELELFNERWKKPTIDVDRERHEQFSLPIVDTASNVKQGLVNEKRNKVPQVELKDNVAPSSETTTPTIEPKPCQAVSIDNISRGVIPNDVKLYNKLATDKRKLEFNPDRSSTPCQSEASVKNIIQEADRVEKYLKEENIKSCDDSNPTPSIDMRRRSPKLTLGKNPQALSGLLKALQKAKRKKDYATDNDCVKDNTHCVTETGCVTANQHCVTVNTDVTNSHDGASIIRSDSKMSDITGAQSPDGSNVTATNRRKNIVGKLKVCLFYNNSKSQNPVLYVTVLKASSLKQEVVTQNEDFYIQMRVNTREDKTQQTKSVSTFSNTAVFNHLFQVHDITLRELQVSTIKLVLVSGHSQQEEAIACVPLAELVARDKIKKTYLLKKYSSKENEVKCIVEDCCSLDGECFKWNIFSYNCTKKHEKYKNS